MKDSTKDVLLSLTNQLWRIVSGPVILLLMPAYLTEVSQGCWYTFTSLAALSVFADLGFGAIVLQFAAHEFTSLRFKDNGTIEGPEKQIQRLASFFKFSVKWGLRATFLAFPLISIGGYAFLSSQLEAVRIPWRLDWGIYSCISGIIFFNNVVLTFFEGCNSVAKLQKIRFAISVATSCVTLVGLIGGAGIFTLVLSGCISAIMGSFLLYRNFKNTCKQLWSVAKQYEYNWWPEFSSLMWRYALSWCSGYFGIYAYTPIAFYFYGPVEAGKIGLSMSMWMAGFNIAMCWLTAMVPKLNMCIELKEWKQLDFLFSLAFGRAMLTMIAGGIVFDGVYFLFSDKFIFFQRTLNFTGMNILYLSWIGGVIINAYAIYLRSHKKEPLMLYSIANGGYVLISTIACAVWLSSDYFFIGFLSSMVGGIPFVWWIYHNQKKAHFKSNEFIG